jgi:hypothetical protein
MGMLMIPGALLLMIVLLPALRGNRTAIVEG